MKKIIFITNELIYGGVEKSLLSLINNINRERYDITIGVLKKGGILENKFPQNIKIIETPQINDSIKNILLNDLKNAKFISIIYRLIYLIRCNLTKDYNKSCNYRSKIYDKFDGKYDMAICFHKPTDLPVAYVINNINAKKKVLWLHMELKNISEGERDSYYKIFNRYDELICVSESIKKQLLLIFPEFHKKATVIYNIVEADKIKRLSKIGYKLNIDDNYIKILTVARLSPEKGHDLIIDTAKYLIDKKYTNFKWYIVGDGPLREILNNRIKKEGLEEVIILLGEVDNPYGYFSSCDIYIQPSLEEGFGITVSEAKLFYKPVIVTNFATSKEHIENNITGYIVDFSYKEIAEKIKYLIDSPLKRDEFSMNLKYKEKQNNFNDIKEIFD